MADETERQSFSARRHRPGGRVSSGAEATVPDTLTTDMEGVAAAYGDTLLFIGFLVNGRIEIVVYPRYRFGADDRVQGQLGTLWIEPGTHWQIILEQVDALQERATRFYQAASTLRAAELRAHGSRFERAHDSIGEIFRESWHGLRLRLLREGKFSKEGTVFEGNPPGPVLVTWNGAQFTLMVAPTGSILMLQGDRRSTVAGL